MLFCGRSYVTLYYYYLIIRLCIGLLACILGSRLQLSEVTVTLIASGSGIYVGGMTHPHPRRQSAARGGPQELGEAAQTVMSPGFWSGICGKLVLGCPLNHEFGMGGRHSEGMKTQNNNSL